MSTPTIPSYRRQRRRIGTDLAFIELRGQRIYLGPYDDPNSRSRYDQLVAEWPAGGKRLPVTPQEIRLVELIAR